MQDSATAREELQHAGAVPLCGLTFLHQCWPHHHDPQTHCSGKCISCRCGLSAWVVAVYVAGQLQSIWNFWNMLLHWIVMTVHWVVMTVISLNRHDCYFIKSSWPFTSLNCHECYFTESSWLFKLDLVYTSLSNKSSLNSDACTFFFVWWIHFCFIVFI